MGGNMIITVGSLVVLGLFTLSSNTMILSNVQTTLQNEHYITAIALAQSVIDEVKTKAFDEKAISKAITRPESCTTMNSMGQDGASETVNSDYVYLQDSKYQSTYAASSLSLSRFDDVDDYNNYTRVVITPLSGTDTIRTLVSYASLTYPDSVSATLTFCKRISVTVSGQYLSRPITLEYAYIY